jgi:hypothetical protein
MLAKELELLLNLLPSLIAKRVEGSKLLIYSTTKTDVTITNLRERVRTQRILFVVIDLTRYTMYLELL